MTKSKKIRFMLDGCDISFVAEAPEDITLKQLLAQADKIKPNWCACGICSLSNDLKTLPTEIVFDYNSVKKADPAAPCTIYDNADWRQDI